MDIFDFENNLEIIDIKNDIYEYVSDSCIGVRRMMKDKARISEVFANYSNTLFFGNDNKGTIKLYNFINNNLEVNLKNPGINLKELIQKEINPDIPLLIVHGGGVEPSDNILQLWEEIKLKEENDKLKLLEEEDEDKDPKERENLIAKFLFIE